MRRKRRQDINHTLCCLLGCVCEFICTSAILCMCVSVLHLTVFNTRLSRGFRLGSLVEERIPVPQLLARVFLWSHNNPISMYTRL